MRSKKSVYICIFTAYKFNNQTIWICLIHTLLSDCLKSVSVLVFRPDVHECAFFVFQLREAKKSYFLKCRAINPKKAGGRGGAF